MCQCPHGTVLLLLLAIGSCRGVPSEALVESFYPAGQNTPLWPAGSRASLLEGAVSAGGRAQVSRAAVRLQARVVAGEAALTYGEMLPGEAGIIRVLRALDTASPRHAVARTRAPLFADLGSGRGKLVLAVALAAFNGTGHEPLRVLGVEVVVARHDAALAARAAAAARGFSRAAAVQLRAADLRDEEGSGWCRARATHLFVCSCLFSAQLVAQLLSMLVGACGERLRCLMSARALPRALLQRARLEELVGLREGVPAAVRWEGPALRVRYYCRGDWRD
jgi:hypothetical protein